MGPARHKPHISLNIALRDYPLHLPAAALNNRPMKVLISAYTSDPGKGSENLRSWNWAQLYLRLGHEVWLFTSEWGRPNIEAHLKAHPDQKLHPVYVQVPDLVEKLDKKRGMWHYVRYMYWQWAASRVAKKVDKSVNFDLVHHISWGSIQQGSGMWKLKKRMIFGPVGGGQHSPEAFKRYFFNEWGSVEMRRKTISDLFIRFNPYCRKTLRKSDLVWVANHETQEIAEQLGAKRVAYLTDTNLDPQTLPQTYPDRAPSEVFRIVWVGRLLTRKGLLLTLEALAAVRKDLPWQLTIVGDGDQGPMIPGWLKELGIEDKVNWLGHQPFSEVRKAYLSHDLFMFTSLRDSSADQFIEAMSHGIPILTLDMHGGRVIVPDHGGIKVQVDTPEATRKRLTDAVEYLYDHPEARLKLGRDAFTYVTTEVFSQKEAALKAYLDTVPV